jgi:4-amino-4-deoxy-L-arabinose transferase-like glycosyltransferase
VKKAISFSLFAWYGAVSVLAIFTYFYGLDSLHVPKNGDEYVYTHITRLTAKSGRLLPLMSDLEKMRNTKPPLLFWQGIFSTQWGSNWTLWHLRYPSVVYTLLTALMVFLLAWKVSDKVEVGFISMLSFLTFFSTYHYGRPFLTNAPEVFWLFLPFFVLIYFHKTAFASRFIVPVLLGICVGASLLYKSFMLVVPVALSLSVWHLQNRGYKLKPFFANDTLKVTITVVISLAIFCLWFAFDPNPQAVFQEFVLQENIGKFDQGGNYFARLLWGGSSIWSLALGYLLNAALMAFPLVALFFVSFRRRRELSSAEKLLWLWVLVLFVVYSLPSNRSIRSLLPGMPALAVLLALNWNLITRKAFALTLTATAIGIGIITYASLRLQQYNDHIIVYPIFYWFLLGGSGMLVCIALFHPGATRALLNACILLFFVCFAAFLRPLDGKLGYYSSQAQQYVRGKKVWVPYNFRAKYERYRFLLPGSEIKGYRTDKFTSCAELKMRYPLFAIQVPLGEPPCEDCNIIGKRLDLRTRLSSKEIRDLILKNTLQNLFVEEYLVEGRTGRSVNNTDVTSLGRGSMTNAP